jgi:hypothetical protein
VRDPDSCNYTCDADGTCAPLVASTSPATTPTKTTTTPPKKSGFWSLFGW